MAITCAVRLLLAEGAGENVEMTTPAETPATEPTSVLLADPNWMIRTAIRGVLDGGGFRIAGDTGDTETALALALEHQPGLVVMGEGLFYGGAGGSGTDRGPAFCRSVLRAAPGSQVLVLAQEMDTDRAGAMATAGAAGYIPVNTGPDALLAVARAVADGEYRLPAPLIKRLLGMTWCPPDPKSVGKQALTRRETQILAIFASGSNYAETGAALGIRPVTIRNTVYRIRNKLGMRNVQQLVLWAARNELLLSKEQPSR